MLTVLITLGISYENLLVGNSSGREVIMRMVTIFCSCKVHEKKLHEGRKCGLCDQAMSGD